MGLDMYLTGKKHKFRDYDNPANDEYEDGFRLESKGLCLGYWRKHPNLHGYIVHTFAGGKDECQEIPLNQDDLKDIIKAVENDDLPHTVGFFFGYSATPEDDWYQEQKNEDLSILYGALKWLRDQKERDWRDVVYRASW